MKDLIPIMILLFPPVSIFALIVGWKIIKTGQRNAQADRWINRKVNNKVIITASEKLIEPTSEKDLFGRRFIINKKQQ